MFLPPGMVFQTKFTILIFLTERPVACFPDNRHLTLFSFFRFLLHSVLTFCLLFSNRILISIKFRAFPLFYTIQTIQTIQNQNNGRNHSIMPCLGPWPGRAHRRLLGQLGQRTLLSGGALQRQRVIAPRPDSRDLPLIPLGRQEPLSQTSGV